MARLRVVSYNIHCGIGWDGRFNERRILDVLTEIEPDVVALQEVESRASGLDMLAWLSKGMGFHAVAGTTLLRKDDAHYGNGLLTRCPVIRSRLLDLSCDRREPRGAISADLDCAGESIRIVATHLGLRPAERRDQVQMLLELFRESPEDRAVLLGDLNEWFLWGRPLRRLHRYFTRTPSPPTYPSVMPFLALDRLWTHPRAILQRVFVHKSRAARIASDHLPLVAELEF